MQRVLIIATQAQEPRADRPLSSIKETSLVCPPSGLKDTALESSVGHFEDVDYFTGFFALHEAVRRPWLSVDHGR